MHLLIQTIFGVIPQTSFKNWRKRNRQGVREREKKEIGKQGRG
jgi:hypothetical protein